MQRTNDTTSRTSKRVTRVLRASPAKPAKERIWKKINKDGPIPEHRPELGPCWMWMGGKYEFGYGQTSEVVDGKCVKHTVHRLVWEITNGPIPDDMKVCHHCDNPPCCNPAHLFLGTQDDNMKDMAEKGRASRGTKNAKSLLTEEDVREIRRLRLLAPSDEALCRDLAPRFGVGASVIRHVLRGESWGWLS